MALSAPIVPEPVPEPVSESAPVEALRQALSDMLGAERRLRGRDHQRAGELTYAQVRAVATLGREPALTAGQLARESGLNPASVTGLLDHLEAAGLVERRRGVEDRRTCLVSLTPEGRELLERKHARWQAMWRESLSEFSGAELDAASRVIGRVGDLFDRLAAKPAEATAPVAEPGASAVS